MGLTSSDLMRVAMSPRKLVLARAGRNPRFSHLGEEEVIARLLAACTRLSARSSILARTTAPTGRTRSDWSVYCVPAGIARDFSAQRSAERADAYELAW